MATVDPILKELAIRKDRRQKLFAKCQTTFDYSKQLVESNVHLFKPRFDSLKEIENRFETIQDEIIELNNSLLDSSKAVEVNQVQGAFDDMVYECRGRYLALIQCTPHPVNNSVEPIKASNHLPRISIPKFAGRISEWSSFFGLFQSMVHDNQSLSEVEKFQYLKSHLEEPALSVISNFALTQGNYQLAYEALKRRYQDKRRLAAYYVHEIKNFSTFTSPTYDNLQRYLSVHANAVSALKALDLPDLLDFILFQLSLYNLDLISRRQFESKQTENKVPTYKELIDFVTNQSRTFELSAHEPKSTAMRAEKPSYSKRSALLANTSSNVSQSRSILSKNCPLCKNKMHGLSNCAEFYKYDLNRRYQVLRQYRRCFSCFGLHNRSDCSSTGACRVCKSKKHHTLLHRDTSAAPESPPAKSGTEGCTQGSQVPSDNSLDGTPQSCCIACHVPRTPSVQTVLLATVQLLISDSSGTQVLVRAVVDPGSQVSAIAATLVQRLGLKKARCPIQVSGIANSRTKVHGTVNCTLRSRYQKDKNLVSQAIVLSQIADDLPSTNISDTVYQRFRSLPLADEDFHKRGKVEFLIGADVYPQILKDGARTMIRGCPTAIETIFGWIVLGPVQTDIVSVQPAVSLFTSGTSLEEVVKRFWETEEVFRPPPADPEDVLCESHFVRTHSRDDQGRYVVSLPFKPNSLPIGNNREVVKKRYFNLERRLSKNPEMELAYNKFLREYLLLGHMSPAESPSTYVIPHHAVVTSKLRVVFHASFPDDSQVSLNDRLMAGPKLQLDLPSILINFRLHSIALCADVKMMFRQFWISPEHRQFTHIFWRPTPDSPVLEYELNTVTYGLKPSAYQAQRCIKQLVFDEGLKFPLAARVLTRCMYVDDIVAGADSIEQALQLRKELVDLFALAGLELRKWASNEPRLLADIPEDHRESPLAFSPDDNTIKILGLMWDPISDCFQYKVKPFEGQVTKRAVLSYIARIFDALGLLAPVVFWAKHFLQMLWTHKLDWDCELPFHLKDSWYQSVQLFPRLENIKIPRQVSLRANTKYLVGFSDASEKGFAAAVYLRAEEEGEVRCSLIQAKCRVAPLKTASIPRLELCGALLLSNLVNSIRSSFPDEFKDVFLFTDSQIVLAWIHTSPHRLKTYVANRVSDITQSTSEFSWFHVSSGENPADIASRGCEPSQLLDCSLWWKGPSFIQQPIDTWAKPFEKSCCPDVPEMKDNDVTSLVTVSNITTRYLIEVIERFSSYSKLQRVLAYVLRFVHNCLWSKRQLVRRSGALSTMELSEALHCSVRVNQESCFSKLLKELRAAQVVKSSLSSLAPYLDEVGLVRVGGRLRNSDLSTSSKHPLLLSKGCHLSKLICDHHHLISLHSGPRVVQALIQRRFWIISLRGLLRQRIRSCLRCFKFSNRPSQPLMADLPSSRVRVGRAFERVGTDFAGPFKIKEGNRRSSSIGKAYLCVFVCMATKAVHLEAVSSLSTKAFLDSFDRFTSRRGLPSDVYSDCGRNYVGANRTLKELHLLLQQENDQINHHCVAKEIRWHYNPAFAPNFGGLWEAVVKSCKRLLYQLVGDTSLTFEDLSTLFSRIEAVLNSRPLCAISNDPHDGPDYLSPGHFLIGTALLASPEAPVSDDIVPSTRWKRLRQIYQSYWRRWSNEYLHTVMQRSKWLRATPNLQLGDVVFIQGIRTSPLSWPIGRVEEVHPGADGTVRVVRVRTSGGSYVRPVNKLVALPSSQ